MSDPVYELFGDMEDYDFQCACNKCQTYEAYQGLLALREAIKQMEAIGIDILWNWGHFGAYDVIDKAIYRLDELHKIELSEKDNRIHTGKD